MPEIVSVEVIATKIFLLRGKKVMLDRDLAGLYGVHTGRLNEQVRRNKKRFPADFMFQLSKDEAHDLMSHFAISRWGGTRKLPHAFTQEGIAMLSSVLNSKAAIEVNILIMRAFVKLKETLLTHKELAEKIETLEKKYASHDEQIQKIFEAMRQLICPPDVPKRRIGFHA